MTLTQTAILVRHFITIFIIALVLGLASFIGYKIWYAYYLENLPPVEEKPDLKFGLLPQLNFPKSTISTSNFSYSLDTPTGNLPKVGTDNGFEKIIKVYFVAQTFATLLSPDRSSSLAEKFSITIPPEILSEVKYRFEEQGKNLVVDLDSGNFAYSKEATVSSTINPIEESKLISNFKQILSSLGVLKNDLKDGRGKVVPTTLPTGTQTSQISIWPAPIDKKQIFTADFNKSLVNAIALNEASQLDDYISLGFTYYPIDTTTFATYPTKLADEAFNDLKNGKGVVVVEPKTPQVSITSVYLGYFLPESYSPYLQPIFVFEGPEFVAYTSAISEQFHLKAK